MKKLVLLALFVLAACAAPNSNHGIDPDPNVPASRVVETGANCGGMMGLVCGQPGDFCKMSAAQQCGAADQTGKCTPRPEICTMNYRPVCGCDGKTYSNECGANASGISAAYAGECRG